MNAHELSKEILTDIEQDRLKSLAKDEVAMDAIKKFILAYSYDHGVIKKGKNHEPTRNFALRLAWRSTDREEPRSDEELGQAIRALAYAVQIVETGFKELKEINEPEIDESDEINKAE